MKTRIIEIKTDKEMERCLVLALEYCYKVQETNLYNQSKCKEYFSFFHRKQTNKKTLLHLYGTTKDSKSHSALEQNEIELSQFLVVSQF